MQVAETSAHQANLCRMNTGSALHTKRSQLLTHVQCVLRSFVRQAYHHSTTQALAIEHCTACEEKQVAEAYPMGPHGILHSKKFTIAAPGFSGAAAPLLTVGERVRLGRKLLRWLRTFAGSLLPSTSPCNVTHWITRCKRSDARLSMTVEQPVRLASSSCAG